MAAIRGSLLVSPGEAASSAGAGAGATTTPGRSPFCSVLRARMVVVLVLARGEGEVKSGQLTWI